MEVRKGSELWLDFMKLGNKIRRECQDKIKMLGLAVTLEIYLRM